MEILHAVLTWLKPFSPWIAISIVIAFSAAKYGRKLNDMDGPMKFDRLKLEYVPVRKRKFPQDWMKDMLRGLAFIFVILPVIMLGGTVVGAVLFFNALFH